MTILEFNPLPAIMDALDRYKVLIKEKKITDVCVVYLDEDQDVEVDILGYEPTIEMRGMLSIAGKMIEKELGY